MPNQATASDLPFYDIFVQQKVPLSKISDDFIACDFWFGPPPIINPGYAYAWGMAFRAVSPQITACAPQARVYFCSSTTSKLLPKNRSPHTLFSMKQQDRSSSLRFCDEDLFFFWSSPSNLRANSTLKKDNIGFGAKYSPDRCSIPNSSGLGCVSVTPPEFLCPPQTHYSGSVPGTVLFYSQRTIYTVVCDQIASKSSSFVLLNASILRKYRGKPSLRSASFKQFIEI